MDLGNLADNPP